MDIKKTQPMNPDSLANRADKDNLIYFLDDDLIYLKIVSHELEKQGYANFRSFSTANDIIEAVMEKSPDITLLDYHLGAKKTGLDVLKKIKEISPESVNILLTASDDINVAIATMKNGAYDYVIKGDTALIRINHLLVNISTHLRTEKKNKTILRNKYITDLENEAIKNLNVELEQSKAKIEASENKHRLLLQHLHAGIVVHAADSSILFVNDQASKLLCLTFDQLKGKTAIDPEWYFVYEDKTPMPIDQYPVQFVITNHIPLHNQVIGVNRSETKDLIWVLVNAFPEFNSDGLLIEVVVTFVDITERKQAEEKIIATEENLKNTFNISPSIICKVDIGTGYFVEVNQAVTRMLGYSAEEFISKPLIEVIHPDDRQQTTDEVSEQQKGKETSSFENRYLCKDGSYKWIAWNATKPNGDDIVTAIGSDITERKRAEQIQKILYNISNVVILTKGLNELLGLVQKELSVIMDTSNFYIAVYDASSDTFSLPYLEDKKDDIISFTAKKTFTYYVVKTKQALLANKAKVKSMIQSGDLEMVGTPSEVWLGVPLKIEEKVIGVLAVQSYTDENAYDESDMAILEFVSEQIAITIMRKKAEQDLLEALEKAMESDRLKSAFLTNMSHEIRTPMNGILGFIDLLNEPDLSKDEIEEYSTIINTSVDRFLTTITDIIDVSRIEAEEVIVSKEETSINGMMDELYSFFSPEVKLKGLSFLLKPVTEQLTIFTDSHKLHGILTNLIKNAIKFTEKGSIAFGYVLKKDRVLNEQDGNTAVEFFVEDTGIGVPKERIQVIFNLFEQAETKNAREFEGSGLGLAISKAYVEMLGGEIFVESEHGKGSKFTFTIPLTKN